MNICAIMMQRDEGELLKSWGEYHGRLLGYSNIFIFDNFSSDKETIEVLNYLKELGVSIDFRIPFDQKGARVSAFINQVGRDYDWCLPLDCDEFIATYTAGQLTFKRKSLEDHLSAINAFQPLVRVENYLMNIPYSNSGYRYPARKIIAKGGCNIDLDDGFHLYTWPQMHDTVDSKLISPSNIVYIHFHNKPFSLLMKSARHKLEGIVHSFTRESLLTHKGKGVHLIQYFMMSEMDYLEGLRRHQETSLREPFETLGLTVPFSTSDWQAISQN